MTTETISRYRIIEQLAEGSLGVVYKAVDTTLRRQVAIKVLSSSRRYYRTRFLREARAISLLSHPGIATVFDYGETPEGQPYIVMELIKGYPLSQKLQKGSLPLPEVVRLISAIAETLGEAHGHGVIHRDIKPSNLFLTDQGRATVLDFGLVKRIPDCLSVPYKAGKKSIPLTTAKDIDVANLYLSPEQATGGKIDARSDLFALGAVMYECLTGLAPFSGETLNEVRARVCNFTPPAPSRINALVPPFLDSTTMKAIEKRVEDRHQSANELIEELRVAQPMLFDSYPDPPWLEGRSVSLPLERERGDLGRYAEILGISPELRGRQGSQSWPKASHHNLQNLESEFDDLLGKMQTSKSKRAMKIAFDSSPAQLGRAAVRHARKQR